MTIREIAKELNVSHTRVYQLIMAFKKKHGREPTIDELKNRTKKVGRPTKIII